MSDPQLVTGGPVASTRRRRVLCVTIAVVVFIAGTAALASMLNARDAGHPAVLLLMFFLANYVARDLSGIRVTTAMFADDDAMASELGRWGR